MAWGLPGNRIAVFVHSGRYYFDGVYSIYSSLQPTIFEVYNENCIWYPGTDWGLGRNQSVGSEEQPHSHHIAYCHGRVNVVRGELRVDGNFVRFDCIVSDGPKGQNRSKGCTKYPNVQFAGNKSKSELAKYYANSDVLVFTSNIDINGTTLLESIASGTPVVAHPTPLAIDIVDDGITGYLGNLDIGIDKALTLDRVSVYNSAIKWSLDQCWETFKYNLVANI